jgi:thiol-disulfide isomerase/thioredoxin
MIELNLKNIIIIISIIVVILLIQNIFNIKSNYYNSLILFNNHNKTPLFVNFNTTWCYWSKKLNSTWKKLEIDMSNKDIKIIDIKCDKDNNKELCKRYQINGYPTIKLIIGNKIIDYEGNRSFEDMKNFIESNVNY